ncbi:MAG: class I SAM-dependent methyltransferase [Thermoanaerobaculia bacterium]
MFRELRRLIETGYADLKESLATIGFLRTVTVVRIRLAESSFDRRHGLDTARRVPLDALDIPGDNKEHGVKYQPTSVLAFRTLLRGLSLPLDSGFLDYGCGKGRVLLLAAEAGFRRVVGVEFSPQLCEIARANVARFRASARDLPPIEIVQADASRYVPASDVGVFYFFNPFDEFLMRQVVGRILDSLRQSPREAWFLLYNAPRHRGAFDAQSELVLERELIAGGHASSVYRFIPPSAGVPSGKDSQG